MDQALFHLINERWTSPALDLFMAALSDVQIWQPLLVAVGLYALIFCGFKGRAFVLCVLVTVALSEALLVRTLKSAIGRPRPKQAQSVRLVQLQKATPKILTLFKQPRVHQSTQKDLRPAGSGSSFPSGHATNNFVIATFCTLFFRRWGWVALLPAGLVAYSRIYVGAHYPSDVLVSIFLAAGQALLLFLLYAWLWKKLAPSLFPKVAEAHPTLLT